MVITVAVRFLVLALLALVAYYIWLFIALNNTEKEINLNQNKIKTDTEAAMHVPKRDELLVRQIQLKELEGVISNHLYWSQLLPEIAKVTLKTASYSSLKVDKSNELVMTVTVPSLLEFDKYLQVFDNPDVNANFSNIRISGLHKIEQGTDFQNSNASPLSFVVNMKINSDLIKYKSPTK